MKILFCPTHYVFDDGDRGSELSWAYGIVDRVATRHAKSVVVTGFKNIKKNKDYEIIELQKNKKEINLGVINAFLFNVLYSKYTYFRLRRERFDVLHHVLPFGIDVTFNLSFLFGQRRIKKLIGPVQNPLPFYRDNITDVKSRTKNPVFIWVNRCILSFFYAPLKYLSRKTLQNADKIVVINSITKKMLIDRGVDSKKIVTIPPGIDCQKFSFSERKVKNPIEILSVGALIERKGFDLVIKAIGEVARSYTDITLRIVGDGPQRQHLESMARELNIESNVIFEGLVPHDQMRTYYANANLFVSMSRHESWGQMYLEAMACGLPIITTRNIGSNEIVRDGRFGFLVEQEDYKTLAEKITHLTKNKHMMEEFGRAGREEVENKYDWDAIIIPKYLDVYNTV